MSDTTSAPSAPSTPSAELGFDATPSHYAGEREALDIIRDDLGDEAFVHWCIGTALKYAIRDGRKEGTTPEDDARKMRFYVEMGMHVGSNGSVPDPRSNRADFKPYVRSDSRTNPAVYKSVTYAMEVTARHLLNATKAKS